MLEGFFPPEDIAAAREDLAAVFPSVERVRAGRSGDGGARDEDGGGSYDISWDGRKPLFPFEGMALNRLVVHDELIDLAQDLLGTEQVRLYQGLASAKYPGDRPTTSNCSTSTTAITRWWFPGPTRDISISSSSSI